MANRIEFCEKDGILITYTNDTVCFENCTTADSILFKNNGDILHNNFDAEKTEFFKKYLKQIYQAVISCRSLDNLEIA